MRYLPVTPTGAQLAYFDLGPPTAAVRVFLGGLGSATSAAFVPVAAHPLLAGTTRQLLVDLIGSGWSDHDDAFPATVDAHAHTVATLLEALALRQVEVVGHSLGGSVAISLAVQRPDLVGRLVVAEPNLDPGVGTFSREVAAYSEEEFVATGFGRLLTATRMVAETDRGDVTFSRTLHRWSARGLHRTAVSLLAERPASFREQLTAYPGEKVYVTGERTAEDVPALRRTGADVRVVSGAGHVLMDDNLDGFVDALVRRSARPA